jgi:hypothetical protein
MFINSTVELKLEILQLNPLASEFANPEHDKEEDPMLPKIVLLPINHLGILTNR